MTSLDFENVAIQKLITHHVGNKLREENFLLSSETSVIESETTDFLLKYFLLPLKAEACYSFSHAVQVSMNEVYVLIEHMFSQPDSFVEDSQSIARLLYEQSMHPKIKEGELNVAYFSNVMVDDKIVEAIGVFKSETNVPFLKMNNLETKFTIHHEFGFEIKGMDKGCLVLNTNQENGYRILIVDNASKSLEAQYWKDDFLNVKPVSNEFHQTNQFLSITKNFVTKQLSEEFEVSKADKIDLLNRSVAYFKAHETFDKKDFEQDVLQDNNIIASFQNYDTTYRKDHEMEPADTFEISTQAVKKQARVFKSVLKLDKNFHIYIHGDRHLIEQGVETDGRKYYKIYYRDES